MNVNRLGSILLIALFLAAAAGMEKSPRTTSVALESGSDDATAHVLVMHPNALQESSAPPVDASMGATSLVLGDPRDYDQVSEEVLSRRWPNGVVPFTVDDISANGNAESEFHSYQKWESITNGGVRFLEINDLAAYRNKPHLKLVLDNDRNASNSSRHLRGIKDVDGNLVTGEWKVYIRTTAANGTNHELGHALGLWHQQRHPDSGMCVELKQGTPQRIGSQYFIGPYQSNSVMHYFKCDAEREDCDFVSWESDSTKCPNRTGYPIDFDAHQIIKMYGINGDYSHDSNFCSGPSKNLYMGDFNGDGLDDLLCHVFAGIEDRGARYVDLAVDNPEDVFGDADWSKTSNAFCSSGPHRQMYLGDFNGDGRDDLICHDQTDGRRFIDHANEFGAFNGTDSRPAEQFCWGGDRQVYIGDFDGDGSDDLLCHNKSLGTRSIDYANTEFDGMDVMSDNSWCKKSSRYIVVGDFNGDGKDDLLCHDHDTGNRWIDYANSAGELRGSNWNSESDNRAKPFCWGGRRRVHVADVDGDSRADLICHNRHLGSISVDFSASQDQRAGCNLWGKDWYGEISLCNASDAHLLIGHLPKNPLTEGLFCHNRVTGYQVARYTKRDRSRYFGHRWFY